MIRSNRTPPPPASLSNKMDNTTVTLYTHLASPTSLTRPPLSASKIQFSFHVSSSFLPILPYHNRTHTRTTYPAHVSFQSPEPANDSDQEKKPGMDKWQSIRRFLDGFDDFRKGLKKNLSPQKKGDWKDLTLISLSFAVYVYISQQIVCAYFAWMSIPKQQW